VIVGILKEIKTEENRISTVRAMQENSEIRSGANVVKGEVTCKGVAEAFDLPYTPIGDLL